MTRTMRISELFPDLRRAVRTAHGCQRYVLLAVWAVLRVRSRWRRFAPHGVDPPDDEEDNEGDYQKAYNCVYKSSIVYGRGTRCLCSGQGIVVDPIQRDEQVCKVHLSQNEADWRHDDVLYEGIDHTTESYADNDADRHVQDVAFHGELLKLAY